jgi:hypothetical protein
VHLHEGTRFSCNAIGCADVDLVKAIHYSVDISTAQ